MYDGKELSFWKQAEEAEEQKTLMENFTRFFTGFGVPAHRLILNPVALKYISSCNRDVLHTLHNLRRFLASAIPADRHSLITEAMLFRLAYLVVHYEQINVESDTPAFYDALREACREEMLVSISATEQPERLYQTSGEILDSGEHDE